MKKNLILLIIVFAIAGKLHAVSYSFMAKGSDGVTYTFQVNPFWNTVVISDAKGHFSLKARKMTAFVGGARDDVSIDIDTSAPKYDQYFVWSPNKNKQEKIDHIQITNGFLRKNPQIEMTPFSCSVILDLEPVDNNSFNASLNALINDLTKKGHATDLYGQAIKPNKNDNDNIQKQADPLVKPGNAPSASSSSSNDVISYTVVEDDGKTEKKESLLAKALKEKNKERNESFMLENAKKPGVKTMPSGLQYKVIKNGSGRKPRAASTVKVKYEGRLINGQVFDGSFEDSPSIMECNCLIKGMQEALTSMPVGSVWEIYIPHYLAYGEQSIKGSVPVQPYSTLIYKIELISIENY